MRNYIDIVARLFEARDPNDEPKTPLPPKAQAILNKPKRVALRKGGEAVLIMRMNRPEHPYGVVIDATIDGIDAGSVHFSPNWLPPPPTDPSEYDYDAEDRGSWSATNVYVYPEFTRRGLATAMYDFATKLGFKILASGNHGGSLKPDGRSLWHSNRAPLRFGKPLPKQSRFWKVRKPSK